MDTFDEHAPICSINSPTSLKAIESLGLEPFELQVKPLSNFRKNGEPESFAEQRFLFFEKRRQADLQAVRAAREKLMEEAKKKVTSRELVVKSTDLEEKQAKQEKIKGGYYRSMRQMLELHVQRHLQYQKANLKIELAAQRDAARKEAEAKQMKEKLEAKRIANELRRAKQTEQEEIDRQKISEAYQQKIEDAIKQKEAQDKAAKDATKAYMAQLEAAEQRRAQLEQIRVNQANEINEKRLRKDREEHERLRKLEARRLQQKQQSDEKKRRMEERARQVAADLARQLEEKREQAAQRDAEAQAVRAAFDAALSEKRQQQREQARQDEAARRVAIQKANDFLEQKRQDFLAKRDAAQAKYKEYEESVLAQQKEAKRQATENEKIKRQLAIENANKHLENKINMALKQRELQEERARKSLTLKEAQARQQERLQIIPSTLITHPNHPHNSTHTQALENELLMTERRDLAERINKQKAYQRRVADQQLHAAAVQAEAVKSERQRILTQTLAFKNDMLAQRQELMHKLETVLKTIRPDLVHEGTVEELSARLLPGEVNRGLRG